MGPKYAMILEMAFRFWIHTSNSDSPRIHVIIPKFRFVIFLTPHRLPSCQSFLFISLHKQGSLLFRSHGVLQHSKVFLPKKPNSWVTMFQPDPDELRWKCPKNLDAPPTSNSLGSPCYSWKLIY